jgi:hypothetical protein
MSPRLDMADKISGWHMQFGLPTRIETILERIEQTLAGNSVLPADCIWPYLGEPLDLLKHPPAERFATLAPMEMNVDQGIVAGGGSQHTALDSRFRLDLFARCARDREFEDRLVLVDASDGLLPLLRAACAAIQLATLETDGQSPLREPMRLMGLQFNPRTPPTGWSYCRSVWQVKFRTDWS